MAKNYQAIIIDANRPSSYSIQYSSLQQFLYKPHYFVVGELLISSFEICEEAKSSSGNPMMFFRLVPTDPAASSFVGNDVYGVRLNKDMLKCELGSFYLLYPGFFERKSHFRGTMISDNLNLSRSL